MYTQVRSGAVAMADDGTRKLTADEQDRLNAGIGSVGLSDEGPLMGGQWISSTTRHGECQRSHTNSRAVEARSLVHVVYHTCPAAAGWHRRAWAKQQRGTTSLGAYTPTPNKQRLRDVEYGSRTSVHTTVRAVAPTRSSRREDAAKSSSSLTTSTSFPFDTHAQRAPVQDRRQVTDQACGCVACGATVHIFAGEVVNGDLDQSKLDKLTIDVDPDCEFIWTDDALNKVRAHSLTYSLAPPGSEPRHGR